MEIINKRAIIATSASGIATAELLATELGGATIITTHEHTGTSRVESLSRWMAEYFNQVDSLIVIGSVGIAVRLIAPHINDKYNDPAVVAVDVTTRFAVSILSGHIGGANILTNEVAHIIGATPVVTTRSDNEQTWALDTLTTQYGWRIEETKMNNQITSFVNGEPTALLLEVRDNGTAALEQSLPANVTVYYNFDDIDLSRYKLLLTVSPYKYTVEIDSVQYHPAVLTLGIGCRRNCPIEGITESIKQSILKKGISPLAIKSVNTIELKKDEPLMANISSYFNDATIGVFTSEELSEIETPNPSDKVRETTGSASVSEASAIYAANYGELIVEKQKGRIVEGGDFTFAIAQDRQSLRQGHIEIVGAGPGDPELVSVKGKRFLKTADLILYAGSLVPIELTHYAKDGAVVRSSASMNLEEQFEIMKEFYDKGLLVVRLHTGDPCIYGAIQEQMALFDEHRMSYHITPGISSFQAAAAALESQFTIPEKVQTIILTRGEGRTAMPEKEKLHLLARSQSTMCIFLSATVVDAVQKDLMEHYPPTTPVAVCYKLTWKDQKIFRGELQNLAQIVKENKLTLTTMIVVGEAIDNRKGLSRLYADSFKHIFRK